MIESYMTIKEAATQWGLSERQIQYLCADGKIENAVKFGRAWAIPKNATKPGDRRITTGEYRNWRHSKEHCSTT